MRADIYVASAADQSGGANHLISAQTVRSMAADEGVSECATLQASRIRYGDAKCWLLGEDGEAVHRHGLHGWVAQPPPGWWEQPGAALVNESFSEKYQLRPGAQLKVPTPAGQQTVQVVGIFTDYGNEHGSIVVPQQRYREWFQTEDVWRVALFVAEGLDADAVKDRLQAAHPGLSIFTQRHLRAEAIRIFTQTFSVTYALEIIGVVVAVAGLGLALASLLLERQAALDTLRALGMTRGEALQAAALEGLSLAAVGSVAGLLGGLCLGWLLIFRVNKQCFGWTLSYHAPLPQLIGLVMAVVCAGTAVAAGVGWLRFRREVGARS
jgi:putative ABC transport system permease protein